MKNLVLTLGLFLMISAVAFSQSQVLSGSWGVSSSTSGYTLDKNEGDRTVTIQVNFLKPFEEKPNVVVGVSSVDIAGSSEVKYDIMAISVSRDGFTVQVKTWGKTKINSITGFWVAHAEMESGE